MSHIVSQLLSLSSDKNDIPPYRTICYRPSPSNPNHTIVHPEGYSTEAPPFYTLVRSASSEPSLTIFLGSPNPVNKVGDAKFQPLSSKIDLSVRGHPMCMKENELTGSFTLTHPIVGKLKWKPGKVLGRSLELRDSAGTKLAHLKGNGFPGSGERRLDMYVSCDGSLIDLMVLSSISAKIYKDGAEEVPTDEVASEVIMAIAGA